MQINFTHTANSFRAINNKVYDTRKPKKGTAKNVRSSQVSLRAGYTEESSRLHREHEQWSMIIKAEI